MKKFLFVLCCASISFPALSCTGIKLQSRDGATVAARTIDWARAATDNIYMIIPRGHTEQSLLPNGTQNGLIFTSKYGFAGLGAERPEFVIDGTNEAGLNVGLFYFPDYGEYQKYDANMNDMTLSDMQVVSWILGQFASINEVKENINNVQIVSTEAGASTVHWRITEPSGRVAVLEFINGEPIFHEDIVGAIANSPSFDWHQTNLNNYVNLTPGTAGPTKLGDTTLTSFSGGTGMLGLPGDFSSPSRFVRAAFISNWSIQQPTAMDTIGQAFHILNNLDSPFGLAFAPGKANLNMPSATQWTIASDLKNKAIYYHTMYNRTIRKIDMSNIDFATIPFQFGPLDDVKRETIIPVQISTE